MIQRLAVLSFVLFCSTLSLAAKRVQADFSKINLEGMQLLNDEGMNTFIYKVKALKAPTQSLVQALESESNSKLASAIFELNERSAFKNIYVYVAKKEDGVFELVQAFVNKSGSIYIVDMDVVATTKTQLSLVHGVHNEEKYTLLNPQNPLFP